MAVKIRNNTALFISELERACADGIERGTAFLQSACKAELNVANRGTRKKVKRRRPGGNKTSRTVYDHPSKPGEPPRKRTGWLQRNVVREVDRRQLAGRVGVNRNAIYGLYLELGTRRIARRPWLASTLVKNRDRIAKLVMSETIDN